MKLRNKKTGEIIETHLLVVQSVEDPTKRYYTASIKDLCDNYEDYKPAEPLIKDEKIRKAVRAWAEVLEVNEVESYGSREWIGLIARYNGADWSSKFELDCYGSENTLVPDKKYTIAELCGEEEE